LDWPIGNVDTSVTTTNDASTYPEGCYSFIGGQLWLATHPSNVGNGVVGTRFPICRRGTLFLL
jgi:hypothetical protein